MGFYENQVLPRVIDVVLGTESMGRLRRRALADVAGTVVEIGFGSGTNLDHYPPAVDRVLAVDPSVVGRKLARGRLARARMPVEFVGLDGQAIDLPDDSADDAVSTWTLCTIPDVAAALAEVRRVVRPGGRLHFLEHGLAANPAVVRRQRRLEPLQRRCAGGCHLTRDHAALLEAAGLVVDRVERFDITGPASMSHMYAGTAYV